MKLYTVRHGETHENRQRICQGQMHGTLSNKGIKQSELTARKLKNIHFDICYCSDLQRAIDSFTPFRSTHPQLPLRLDARLRERAFGSFQGKMFPANMNDFVAPPDAESLTDFCARLQNFYEQIKSSTEENILIISHGVAIRALIAIVQGKGCESINDVPEIINSSVSVIELIGENYTKISTCHP